MQHVLFVLTALGASSPTAGATELRNGKPALESRSIDHSAPATLPFQVGAPVPEGYVVRSRFHKGPMIGGAFAFGVPYAIGAVVGATSSDTSTRYLWIPVAGPWLTIATAEFCTSGSHECAAALPIALLAMDSLLQVGGIGLFIFGATSDRKQLIRADLASVTIVPASFGRSPGLVAVGRF
jgi:hypothetical protein